MTSLAKPEISPEITFIQAGQGSSTFENTQFFISLPLQEILISQSPRSGAITNGCRFSTLNKGRFHHPGVKFPCQETIVRTDINFYNSSRYREIRRW